LGRSKTKRFERVKQILEGVSWQTSETIKDKPTGRLIGYCSIDPFYGVLCRTEQCNY
jgi:hypothetical protein